jgi:5'-nucleotidase
MIPHLLMRRATLVLVFTLSLALSLSAQSPRAKTVRVTLLQVNDVYQISPSGRDRVGGLARLATLKKKIQAESPHALLLLSGDTLSPSVASNIFKGEQMIASWNVAGLDYATLGNHEFDFGDDILRQRIQASKFTWLAANVIDRRTGKPFGGTPPFVIRSFDGVKVGFFGLLTPETKLTSSPGKDVIFLDPYRTAARIVRKLRARGARVIVAITHLSMAEDKRLARSAPIDVIIGGHEHDVLQSQAGCTPIFKMGSDARLLGRIDLNIAARTGRLENLDFTALPVNDKVADDPAAAAVINEYERKLSAELDKPVGSTKVELDARSRMVRSRETNLGSFIADAFRQATGADVVIFNGGSIRSDTTYGPGALSRRDVITILPFETPIVKIETQGAQLRAALEHGVARIVEEAENGRFPQVSGLQFVYDGRRPAGSRVVEVMINGQPLDDGRTYTLASGTYLINGGDGYTMFRNARWLIKAEEARIDAVILADAIAAAGEIAPQPDGRIKRLDAPDAQR